MEILTEMMNDHVNDSVTRFVSIPSVIFFPAVINKPEQRLNEIRHLMSCHGNYIRNFATIIFLIILTSSDLMIAMIPRGKQQHRVTKRAKNSPSFGGPRGCLTMDMEPGAF